MSPPLRPLAKVRKLLDLAAPDWGELIGGEDEAVWLADRDRKFGLAMKVAGRIFEVEAVLRERDALYVCSPDALRAHPLAADWYIRLVAFSNKTLSNVKKSWRNFGLSTNPLTIAKNSIEGKTVKDADLEGFSDWVNSEIDHLYPQDARRPGLAAAIVLLTLGGQVVGQGQNVGGDEAVVLVKTLLVESFQAKRTVEVELDNGAWVHYQPVHNLPERRRIRFGGRLVCEFISGGDRPDIKVFLDSEVVAVGEIKGRKDLSNVWESWMPQVADHMRTWATEFASAARLFLGTLITNEMIEGVSFRGTARTGFKEMHANGWLTGAYNVSKTVANDPKSVEAFDDLTSKLDALI